MKLQLQLQLGTLTSFYASYYLRFDIFNMFRLLLIHQGYERMCLSVCVCVWVCVCKYYDFQEQYMCIYVYMTYSGYIYFIC